MSANAHHRHTTAFAPSAEMFALTALGDITQAKTHSLTAHLNKLRVQTIPEEKKIIQGA